VSIGRGWLPSFLIVGGKCILRKASRLRSSYTLIEDLCLYVCSLSIRNKKLLGVSSTLVMIVEYLDL